MMRAKLSTCALLLALSHPLYAVSELPAPGMSMQAVESQFGQPSKKNPAVGTPPITRWEYGDYVVVFERATVISSIRVVRQASTPAPTQPAASTRVQIQPAPTPAPAPAPAAPVEPANPPAAEAPQPAAAPAAEPVAAPAAPAEATAAPTEATDPSARATQEQEAMEKAAAEKAASEGAQPAAPTPSEGESVPSPNQGYTFDPETGRIIIK